MPEPETTGAATSPDTEMTLDQAVAAFEAEFEEVDDSPQQTNDSHAPNGAAFERFVVPAGGQQASKNPKPASFETRGEAVAAWLTAVKARFSGKDRPVLWWRARPRIIRVEPGEGVTVYGSLASGKRPVGG